MLGVFWYRHDQQYRAFRVITPGMLLLHFAQLAGAAFFPFCAALMGRYPTERAYARRLSGLHPGLRVVIAIWVLAWKSGSSADLTIAAYQASRNRWLRMCLVVSMMFVLNLIRALAK